MASQTPKNGGQTVPEGILGGLEAAGFPTRFLPTIEPVIACSLPVLARQRVLLPGERKGLLLDPLLTLQNEYVGREGVLDERTGFAALQYRKDRDERSFLKRRAGHDFEEKPLVGAAIFQTSTGEAAAQKGIAPLTELLTAAAEQVISATGGCTVRLGHTGIFDLFASERERFGPRVVRFLEENLPALKDADERAELLADLVPEEEANGSTLAFIERFRKLNGAGADRDELCALLSEFLGQLDLQGVNSRQASGDEGLGTEMADFVERVLQKADFRGDCLRAKTALKAEAKTLGVIRESGGENSEFTAAAKKLGGDGATAIAEAVIALEVAVQSENADVKFELELLPDNLGGFYSGWAFELLDGAGNHLGDGGGVTWLPADPGPAGLATYTYLLELDLFPNSIFSTAFGKGGAK